MDLFSTEDSAVRVLAIATNEEIVIGKDTRGLITQRRTVLGAT